MAARRLPHIVLGLVGAFILIFLFYRLGPQNILSLLRHMGLGFLGLVLIYGMHMFVRALALGYCLPSTQPSFRELLYVRVINEAVRGITLTGPFLSEPVTAWFISKLGVRSSEAAAATIAEYVAHTFMAAVLTIPTVMYLLHYRNPATEVRIATLVLLYGSIGLVAITIVVLWQRIYLIGSVASSLSRVMWLGNRISPNLGRIRRTEDALFHILRDRPGVLLRLIGLEIIAHALLILETRWALVSMGVSKSIVTAFLVEVLSKISGVATVGATEGAYALLFFGLGLAPAAGFTLSLVKRIRSLAITLIGIASLAALPQRVSGDSRTVN